MRGRCRDSHVERALGLGRLLFGAVADQSRAVGQAQVEGQQGSVLHADGPQGGAVDLEGQQKYNEDSRACVCVSLPGL